MYVYIQVSKKIMGWYIKEKNIDMESYHIEGWGAGDNLEDTIYLFRGLLLGL